MTRVIVWLASALQFCYSMMLVVVGAVGIFTPRWEFATIYGIDSSVWSLATQATMFNQYRFLKSVELGAGLFCLAYRQAILGGQRAAALFLALVLLGVSARSIAWIVDGRPAALFIAFLVLEALVFIAVALHLRVHHGQRTS